MAQFERDWALYLALLDMVGKNPDLPNIALPKMYSIIETKAPQITGALFGRRPYIPWESLREEMQELAEIQVRILDELLAKAMFKIHGALVVKMALLYGTAFANVLPYFEKVDYPELVDNEMGQPSIREQNAYRLRLKVEVWAPWEIYADPYAVGLAEPEECRFVNKIQIVSKRQLKGAYEKGAFPNFDIEQLDAKKGYVSGSGLELDFGQRLLINFGLPKPTDDDDLGILVRYESPERYITRWYSENNHHTLDGDKNMPEGNHFRHGRINLSRSVHTIKPHTQEQFWGDGEARPNEVVIQMLNDSRNFLFQKWQMMSQPMMLFRKGHINKEDLVFAFAQRVPVKTDAPGPISDSFHMESGVPVGRDDYLMTEMLERDADLTARSFEISRGESTPQNKSTGTFSELALRKNISDSSQELTISINETVFLQDFGCKAASIFDQYKNFGDVVDLVGEEDAVKLFTADPKRLPGGCKFTFKGSDKVANQLIKQANMRDLAPLIAGAARPGGFERELLEVHDFEQKEIDKILYSEEEMMQMQLLQMLSAGMGQESSPNGSKKKTESQPRQPMAVN